MSSMTDEQTPATTAAERRQRLLETIRRSGGTWGWRRARETYDPRPEPKRVRADLQKLCKEGLLVRIVPDEYRAAEQ
jgi:hypothetical protein